MLTEPQRAELAARLRRGRTDVPGGIGRRATGLAELALMELGGGELAKDGDGMIIEQSACAAAGSDPIWQFDYVE